MATKRRIGEPTTNRTRAIRSRRGFVKPSRPRKTRNTSSKSTDFWKATSVHGWPSVPTAFSRSSITRPNWSSGRSSNRNVPGSSAIRRCIPRISSLIMCQPSIAHKWLASPATCRIRRYTTNSTKQARFGPRIIRSHNLARVPFLLSGRRIGRGLRKCRLKKTSGFSGNRNWKIFSLARCCPLWLTFSMDACKKILCKLAKPFSRLNKLILKFAV